MYKDLEIQMQQEIFEEEAWNIILQDDPFSTKNQESAKSVKPEECKVAYHNYGIRKDGFCANCNGKDLHIKK